MLGRNSFTQDEVDHAKALIAQQIAAYKALAKIAGADRKGAEVLDTFEPLFFNNLALALDRYFVHRIRPVTGKDGNPLNELEMITESLMSNNGQMAASKVIKMIPDQSILKLQVGDAIALTLDQFERLSSAFFEDLQRKFVQTPAQ
jgi:hypothetical protein